MFDSIAHRTKKARSALGGRSLTLYCASNARSATSTESPSPTIPSSTLGLSSAIQSPLRNDKLDDAALMDCLDVPRNTIPFHPTPFVPDRPDRNITKKNQKILRLL